MANTYEVKRGEIVIGTYTSAELKEMAASGTLKRDDLVRQWSSDKSKRSDWTKASEIKSFDFGEALVEEINLEETISDDFDSSPVQEEPIGDFAEREVPSIPLVSGNSEGTVREYQGSAALESSSSYDSFAWFSIILDKFVDWLSTILGSGRLIKNKKSVTKFGNLFLNVSLVIYLIGSLWVAIKVDSIEFMLLAIGFGVVIAIGQYMAVRFIIAGDRVLDSSPTQVNNLEIIRLLGFLITTVAVALCVSGIYMSIKMSQIEPAVGGILFLVVGVIAASLVFSPSALNITVSEGTSAGMELLGIVSFFVKMNLVLGPYVYFLGTFGSIIIGIRGLYFMTGNDWQYAIPAFSAQALFVLVASIFPLVIYLIFLIYYLYIDVIRAILDIDINVRDIQEKSSD